VGKDNSPALPTFEQAGRFAGLIGCKSPEDWARYTAGLSRTALFEKVLTVINNRITFAPLEG
jgi:hypothetical protein